MGESAPLSLTAAGNTKYTLSSHGDSAALENETLTAVKPGETIIYARSDDGRYVSAMIVKVTEPQEIETEPVNTETEPVTEPETADNTAAPAETEPAVKEDGKGTNNTVLIVVIAVAAAAAAAPAAPPEPSAEEKLLTEIRDLLKK